MSWEVILAIVLLMPLVLFPAALVWYLNLGRIIEAFQERRKVTRGGAAKEHAGTG
jgi:hypothetical protein